MNFWNQLKTKNKFLKIRLKMLMNSEFKLTKRFYKNNYFFLIYIIILIHQ